MNGRVSYQEFVEELPKCEKIDTNRKKTAYFSS